MIKDKKLIETTLDSLQYMLDSEDEYIPFDEATNEYINVFSCLDDDNILWGDSDSCILKNIVIMSKHILDKCDEGILWELLQDTDNSLLREYLEVRL